MASIFDQARNVLKTLKQGKANPLLQGIYDLPASTKILAQRAPQAVNQLVMDPRVASNFARNTPQTANIKVPGMQSFANFSTNTAQSFGQGLQDMAMGYNKVSSKPGAFNKLQGGAQMIAGAGKTIAPFTLPFQMANMVTSVPQSNNLVINPVQRFSAGVLRGMSGDEKLAENVKNKNDINLNLFGTKIGIDPAETAGQMVGFVKNPINKQLFKLTNSVFPTGSLGAKGTNLKKWLAVTGLRGGVENILLDLAKIPENATNEQKISFMLRTAGVGSITELGGRGMLDVSGAVGNKVFNNKQLVQAFNELRFAYNKLNIPVATTNIDPTTGKRVTMPMWKYRLDKMGINEKGFIKPDEFLPKPKSDIANAGSYDITPDTKLSGELYDIVNKEYRNLQSGLMIDKNLMEDLPKNISLKEAIGQLDRTGINYIGGESAAEIAQLLKNKGYRYSPDVANAGLYDTVESYIASKLGGKISAKSKVFAGEGSDLGRTVGKGTEVTLPDGNRLGLRLRETDRGVFVSGIAVDNKGSGVGTKTIDALKDYVNKKNKIVFVEDVINPKFFKQNGFVREGQDWVLYPKNYPNEQAFYNFSQQSRIAQPPSPNAGLYDINGKTYKQGEEVGFAGILSPEGEARKGKLVRKINDYLVEVDYGDHVEQNHVKNIFKLNEDASPVVQPPLNDVKPKEVVKQQDTSQGQTMNAVSIEASPKTMEKVKIKQAADVENQAKAEYNEWRKQVFNQANANRTISGAVKTATNAIKTNTVSPVSRNTDELKDIGNVASGMRDVYRNFKAVYGKRFEQVKQIILDPFDRSKGELIDEYNNIAKDLDENIVKKLGIKKGSNESRLVQLYGEGKLRIDELRNEAPTQWQNIVKADAWFRQNYDSLLDEVNAVRGRIYPGQADKIIPKRKDYYRHFKEMAEGFTGLRNIFEGPANISSTLAGVSDNTKPKSKWLSFAQKRTGDQTVYDAVGGFLEYAKAAGYAKHIDPHTATFRNLAEELAAQTKESGNINNFIEFLQDFTNDLAGKTNPLDRAFQKWMPGGRKTFKALNWLNSRIKANTIVGNLSSTVAQIFNVPQGIASAGPKHALRGLGRSLASMFTDNKEMNQSTFLKERYFRSFDKFDTGLLKDTKKFAVWMTSVLDEVGSKYIWNAHYSKALGQNIPNPVKYADDATRSLVAGRGIGEVPLMQKSKTFQLAAPFQLEVANLWWVMKDMVDEKAFGKLATLFIANYVFNRGAEAVRGSAVTFDPIQAMVDAFGELDEENGVFKAGGRLTGEVLSNVPGGQTLAAAYPEYGFKVGDTQMPTRKSLFGRSDPTRFGSGILASKGLQDPLFKVIPPFGGSQIKKTIEGVKAYAQGYSESKSGNPTYPVKQNAENLVKSVAFGKYATPEARTYFANMGKSQGEIIYNEIKSKSTAKEKAELWNQMVKEGKITKQNASSIKQYFLDQKMGLLDSERKYRNLGVTDGSRARMVYKQISKKKTPKEKVELWNKYVEAKIITEDVAIQLKKLMKKNQL